MPPEPHGTRAQQSLCTDMKETPRFKERQLGYQPAPASDIRLGKVASLNDSCRQLRQNHTSSRQTWSGLTMVKSRRPRVALCSYLEYEIWNTLVEAMSCALNEYSARMCRTSIASERSKVAHGKGTGARQRRCWDATEIHFRAAAAESEPKLDGAPVSPTEDGSASAPSSSFASQEAVIYAATQIPSSDRALAVDALRLGSG